MPTPTAAAARGRSPLARRRRASARAALYLSLALVLAAAVGLLAWLTPGEWRDGATEWARVDYAALPEVQLLQEYIAIDTSETGDQLAGARLHEERVPKALLRQSFEDELPDEIVNRPKAKFSKGAGSSELIAHEAVEKITDQEFTSERDRLKKDWDYNLQNKEALYYYRLMRDHYEDEWILPTMGSSRSL
jgi:asparagine synthase (glutamine-hydrolysing)